MKKLILSTGISLLIVALVCGGCSLIGSSQEQGQGESNMSVKYTKSTDQEIMDFFNSNRPLFEDIKGGIIVTQGTMNSEGYLISLDSNHNQVKEWCPGLSENAVKYYDLVTFPQPSIDCGYVSGVKEVTFSFYYQKDGLKVGIVYSEAPHTEQNYTKLDDNWYYFKYGMT